MNKVDDCSSSFFLSFFQPIYLCIYMSTGVVRSGNVEALVQNVMNNKANQEKSVWDQYLEKRKEKKKQKKAAKVRACFQFH